MALDLQEQEQIAQFKAWWYSWGKYLIAFLLILVLAYLGYKGWQAYHKTQAEDLSTLFITLEKDKDDPRKVLEAAKVIIEQYPDSAYASRAALLSAKAYVDLGNKLAAQKELMWILSHSEEESLRDLTRLRLAALFLDEKKYDQALKQVKEQETESYRAAFLEMKGDILVATTKIKEAIEAYKQAYAKVTNDIAYRQLLEIKLDALETQ